MTRPDDPHPRKHNIINERIGIVGGGIIGLAVARRVLQLRPDARLTLLEKESAVATHQTSHNSGVAHAGVYYTPGSLKAQLCRRGIAMLKDYCAERQLPYEECGKIVVATTDAEVAVLRDLEARARANGVPALRWLSASALHEIEPHAVGKAALHSPSTAIVDYAAIAAALRDEIERGGAAVCLHHNVTQLSQGRQGVTLSFRAAEDLQFDRLILCAGLHSDRLARLAGDTPGPAIVPFRGEYYRLVPDKEQLVRGLIYPVPDPRYPFLGIHLTRRVGGGVEIGPNAILALAREGYRRRDVRIKDIIETMRWAGFRKMARSHWKTGLHEIAGSLSRRTYVSRAQRYVPDLSANDVIPGPAGVRAQAIDIDGTLVDDFRISHLRRVTAVRNAPSPGATSALAIAEHIAESAFPT